MSNYTATSKGLFLDGKQVIPEFGNADQIKAVRKHEQRMELLKGDGYPIEADVTIEASVTFNCICGHSVRKEVECRSIDDDIKEEFDMTKMKCGWCNTNYIFTTGEFGDLKLNITQNTDDER